MIKHTPGPWIVDEESVSRADAARGLRMIEDGDRHELMLLQRLPECGPQEFAANAALIASAPDLLAAAEDALVELASWEYGESEQDAPALGVIGRLRAAIAKARGEQE